jgi:hypothetical protein
VNKLRIKHEADVVDTGETLPVLLSEKRAAAWLGVSISFLRKSRSTGAIGNRTPAPKFVSIGGRRLYKLADLKAWSDGLESQSII